MVIISEELAWDAEDAITNIQHMFDELQEAELRRQRLAKGRYKIVKGVLQSDSVEAFMGQPEDVRNTCYERALKSSGFVRWEPDGAPESLATLPPRAYDLLGHEAEHYFPSEDFEHSDYTRLVTEAREYVFSNNAFEIEIEYLMSFLRLPGVKRWLRQIRIIVCPREIPEPLPSDDVSCSDLGEYWQENSNTVKTLLKDCEQLDWVVIQIWPEDDYSEDFDDEDDEDEEDYSEEDDIAYYSDDYHDEGDYMAYTYGITNTTSHGRRTRRRIQAWIVAERRAKDVINMLKDWGPTISPLSRIMSSQMELFKNGTKKKDEKQVGELVKGKRQHTVQQKKRIRPQRGVIKMLFQPLFVTTLLSAITAVASPTWSAEQEYTKHLPKSVSKHQGTRPKTDISPKKPFKPFPSSPSRNRVCYVSSHNDGVTDDSNYILSAINKCNNGGHVIFSEGQKYVIGTALNLTNLNHIDLDIQGYVQFTNDTDYWQANAFKQVFQNATTFFQLGGNDVNVYGGGFLDGNGQVWYDLYAQNIYILRPVLFGVVGLHNSTIQDLNLRYSPQYYNWVANSTNVLFSNISISGYSQSKNVAKNTDGWDTYRSDNIVIQNSVINNGDDCVSFKPNSTNMLVQNLQCNGSHGISVGSLGQYPTETDIVENVLVYNISMSNASDGARIKVWPGSPAALSGDLQGGGGKGRVNNITYDTMNISNVDYAIEVTQCYGQKNLTACNEFPSELTISNIVMKNIHGTTSSKYSPISGYVVCSSPSVCTNIQLSDINVSSPNGTVNEFSCGDVDQSLLQGIQCTSINKGYN
ncbi:PGX, glycoside hydrolase family 28 protein, partial [Aureobasidium melanogenum]